MRRALRAAAVLAAVVLTTGTAADSTGQEPAPAATGGSATYDVLPTGGGLEDCGCTGGARARSRIELGLIPGHKPQDVPEVVPSKQEGATPGDG